jgi:hypothetical protein
MSGSVDLLADLMPRLIATMTEPEATHFIKVTLQIRVLYHAGFADLTRSVLAGLVHGVLDEPHIPPTAPDIPSTAEIGVQQPRYCVPTHATGHPRPRFVAGQSPS